MFLKKLILKKSADKNTSMKKLPSLQREWIPETAPLLAILAHISNLEWICDLDLNKVNLIKKPT